MATITSISPVVSLKAKFESRLNELYAKNVAAIIKYNPDMKEDDLYDEGMYLSWCELHSEHSNVELKAGMYLHFTSGDVVEALELYKKSLDGYYPSFESLVIRKLESLI